jgi:hypothetical protein
MTPSTPHPPVGTCVCRATEHPCPKKVVYGELCDVCKRAHPMQARYGQSPIRAMVNEVDRQRAGAKYLAQVERNLTGEGR